MAINKRFISMIGIVFMAALAQASYTISVGSFPPERAAELYKHLSTSGYPVFILYGETHEVRLGSYEARSEAEAVKDKLEEEEKIVAQILEEEAPDQSQFTWPADNEGKEVGLDAAANYSDSRARQIVSLGLDLFGHPYKYGGTKIGKGIDCSFFTQTIFKELGISLPRTAREQIKSGKPVDKSEIQVGDLVFFLRGYRTSKSGKRTYSKRINHVGIYIGNGEFIHATINVKRVTISRLDETYFTTHFAGARRVLNDKLQTAEVRK